MAGQPRRVYTYARSLETLNDWVSISSFLLGVSILIFVANFVYSTVIARVQEEGNPWRSRGLEWQVASPPPPGNFARVPVVLSGPYEYGMKDAPPVADLDPPLGVLSNADASVVTEGAGA
jgi:cytochrome c oxidase subunit 1